ncbi:DMT family transporter [Benzoatithermus flavus]|uniref:DMT family transporter n=1 Tax=Benzoatithermus flavus TaxID=3108223 RepID=A0ABU8XQP3_9PROT
MPSTDAGRRAVPRAAILLIAAITVLWGLNWPAMKMAVSELSPWTFRAACVVISGTGLMAIAWFSGERLRLPRAYWRSFLVVASCSVTGWNLLSAFSLKHMAGGRGAIIAYTMPVWAAIFSALWLGERLEPRRILALVLGMIGIGFAIGPDLVGLSRDLLGPLFMILAAICWAAGTVAIKTRAWPIGMMAHTAWQLVIGGMPIVLAWLVIEPRPDLGHLTWRGILATLYAAIVGLIFCFAAFNKVVTLLPATAAAISILAIPIVGVLGSAWLLGEPAGWRELVALVLVLGAMSLVLIPRRLTK